MHCDHEQSKTNQYGSREHEKWRRNRAGWKNEKREYHTRQEHEQVRLNVNEPVVQDRSSRVSTSHPLRSGDDLEGFAADTGKWREVVHRERCHVHHPGSPERQPRRLEHGEPPRYCVEHVHNAADADDCRHRPSCLADIGETVSYTHLTLPTSDLV